MATKILTIIGARPQFVKASVVSRAFARNAGLNEILVHTGQHFDANMSAIFFDELGIRHPQYNLGIGGGTHASNTGRAMEGVETIILSEAPDLVLVYGDTDSTLAGALAAAKLSVPIAHVEAGLRSFNRHMPEEVNRVLTDHVSDFLFAPSQVAVDNLANEGVTGDKVSLVGDVMFDAVKTFTEVAERKSDIISRLGLASKAFILATLHRKENTDHRDRLAGILAGLDGAGVEVILPLHPRTRKRIAEFGLELGSRIRVIDPVGYFDMMLLERHARCIATDSGGVQKEAYFHGVPCAVLRDETEWVELVDVGVNRLVGANPDAITEALRGARFGDVSPTIYGSGDTSVRIADALAKQA